MSEANTSNQHANLIIPDTTTEDYQNFRENTDLREPYRLPKEALIGTKEIALYDVAESPIIAFINSKSGGHMGPDLLKNLQLTLGNEQVFDLSKNKPENVLNALWQNLEEMERNGDARVQFIRENLKIVACGGDGTVAWVMKAIKELNPDPVPPVAIIPLGTGNDLSRTFKWGRTFKKKWIKDTKAIYNHMKEISGGERKDLDCWQLNIKAPSPDYFEDVPVSLRPQEDDKNVIEGLAWNYFSIGMDSKSAYGFHHLRNSRPSLAASRHINMLWYVIFGFSSGWFCCFTKCNPPVNNRVTLEVENDGAFTEVEIPNSVKALVILNLQSYGGGKNIFGTGKISKAEKQKSLERPAVNDGQFEVVGLKNGWHTGAVLAELIHGVRLAQGSAARIKVKAIKSYVKEEPSTAHMQLDGEPWAQLVPNKPDDDPIEININYHGQNKILMNKRKMNQKNTSVFTEGQK